MKLRELILATLYLAKQPLSFRELKARVDLYLHLKYGRPHPNCRCHIAPIVRIEGTIEKSHKDGDITIVDKFKIEGISLITEEEAEI